MLAFFLFLHCYLLCISYLLLHFFTSLLSFLSFSSPSLGDFHFPRRTCSVLKVYMNWKTANNVQQVFRLKRNLFKWAATCEHLTYVPNKASNQPAHPSSLVRVFIVHMKRFLYANVCKSSIHVTITAECTFPDVLAQMYAKVQDMLQQHQKVRIKFQTCSWRCGSNIYKSSRHVAKHPKVRCLTLCSNVRKIPGMLQQPKLRLLTFWLKRMQTF